MELAEYNVFADKCFRDTPPPCAAVCPLDMDIREFIRLMRKGSVRSAYKVIQRSLIFPSIVTEICPEMCRKACVRGRLGDESVDLRSLEKICVEKMAGKKPDRYNIPQKKRTTVVIGAGLSGLACAYRLASYGYQVKVYEKDGLIGGALPEKIDRQWAHDEITREFLAVRCEFALETEITSLRDIQADALYIATGAGGNAFRSENQSEDSRSFQGMIVRGGRLTGADLVESMRMGLTAAEMINNELLTDRSSDHIEQELTVPERCVDERYYHLHYDTSVPDEIPAKGAAEAFRCMRCNCSECYDVCPLMEKHRQYPKKICNEIIVTLKPNKSRRTAVRLIMGCTDCGACREACPEHIDMGRCLEEARSDFYESGVMSPAFHDYWLQDMDFCESDEARLLQVRDTGRPSDILYFPGCQLSASMPSLVTRSYDALANACTNPSILLSCCGVPAKWAGLRDRYRAMREQFLADWEKLGRPLVVTACPSCLQSMKDLHPEMRVVSYYHFAAEHPELFVKNHHFAAEHPELFVKNQAVGARVKVVDPCSSVAEEGMVEAVRDLLCKAGYEVLNEKPDPACCGFGGHIYNAVPALHDTFAARRWDADEDPDVIAASYCANCRDILAYRGADARHVLGMLLGVAEERRRPPELEERRENRLEVRKALMGCDPAEDSSATVSGEIPAGTIPNKVPIRNGSGELPADNIPGRTPAETVPGRSPAETVPGKSMTGTDQSRTLTGEKGMEILIPEKLIDKMDRGLILRGQVNDLICEAEETGCKIYDEADNIFIAHKRFGAVTIWAVYSYTTTAAMVSKTGPEGDLTGTIGAMIDRDSLSNAAGNVSGSADSAPILVENVYWHRMEIREDQQ